MNLSAPDMNYNLDGNSRYTHLISFGHGHDTPGKRSPKLANGSRLLEWKYVRAIGEFLLEMMKVHGLNYLVINPETNDVRVSVKSQRANNFAARHKSKCILYALHGNAASYRYIDPECRVRYNSKIHSGVERFYYKQEWHPAHGLEAFTSRGDTLADPCTEIYLKNAKKYLPDWRMRTDTVDGDLDKEADFWMLKHTSMPSMLLEMGFYTNKDQVKEMLSDEGQILQAEIILQTMREIEALRPLG